MSMPAKLSLLIHEADTVLYDLYREMEGSLAGMEGEYLWLEVYRMRVKLRTEIRPMVENNFRELPL